MGEPLSRDPEALEVELELLTDLEVFLEGLGTLKVNWWWGCSSAWKGSSRLLEVEWELLIELGVFLEGLGTLKVNWWWICSSSWKCSSRDWAP